MSKRSQKQLEDKSTSKESPSAFHREPKKTQETKNKKEFNLSDVSSETDEYDEEDIVTEGEQNDLEDQDKPLGLFIPRGKNTSEKYEYDPAAYDMYHKMMLEWSCYSIDVIRDTLGANRITYPHTMTLIAGTQADTQTNANKNRVYVMKCKNLVKMKKDDDSDSESDTIEDDDPKKGLPANQDGILDFRSFIHPGGVNRLQICTTLPRLCATWSEDGHIYMWDVKKFIDSLEISGSTIHEVHSPLFQFQHKCEGFALDFNPQKNALLATGCRDHSIHIFTPCPTGWETQKPINIHKGSVEGIAWKRLGNPSHLASCSTDRSIRLHDITIKSSAQVHIPNAHQDDVNTIAWSPHDEHLLLSGGDDGVIRIWDMRNVLEPITHLTYHQEPITCVSWNPFDSATFSAASLDNTITLWDMSLEKSEEIQDEKLSIPEDYPDQLMFQHMGQTHITEVKWHSQIPGKYNIAAYSSKNISGALISTAEDSIDIFKTFNI